MARQDELVSAEAAVSISLVKIYKGLGGGWQLRLGNPYTGFHPLQIEAMTLVHQTESIQSKPVPEKESANEDQKKKVKENEKAKEKDKDKEKELSLDEATSKDDANK